MNIAYVEDDADTRTIFQRKLEAEHIHCDTFTTGEELLKKGIVPGQYDLLLVDIRLPGCNGVKLLEQLRQKGVFTPSILITGFNSLEYARDALNSGANYLLEKPFTFASLMKVIRKVTDSPQALHDRVDRGLTALALSEREAEIARLLLKGLGNKDIADIVRISEKTVKQHITRIFEKAGVSSRSELFSFIFPV